MKPRIALRDDGMSDGDYIEQLTYLLFAQLPDDRSRTPYRRGDVGKRGPPELPRRDRSSGCPLFHVRRMIQLAELFPDE